MTSIEDPRGIWGPLAEPLHTSLQLAPDSLPWRENSFFCCFDREQGFYCTAHIQGGLNARGMWARCSIVLDGQSWEVFEPLAPMEVSTPGIHFDLAGRMSVKSPDFELDISYVPIHQPASYSQANVLPGLSDTEVLQHFQQGGTFSGTVSTGSTTREVTGRALRDRTWGYREEISTWTAYYATFLCFPDFDMTFMKVAVRDRDVPAHGFLVGARSATIIGSTVTRRDPWGAITRVELGLEGGESFSLELGRPEARIFVPLNDPQGAAALTAYDDFIGVRTSDGAVGFGIMEQGILRQQT
jgi:hypothetical protein